MHTKSRFALLLLVPACTAMLIAAGSSFARGPESVADVAEGLQDSVVNVSTTQTVKESSGETGEEGEGGAQPGPGARPKGSPFEQFFDDFFDEQQKGGPHKVSSLGSGFVIDPSGIIVTNNHVIEGADEIIINFVDGKKLKVVKVLGHDPKTDLALLKVEPKEPLKAATFGDSTKMRVGDWVMAIGNPFGLGGSVTVGIISTLLLIVIIIGLQAWFTFEERLEIQTKWAQSKNVQLERILEEQRARLTQKGPTTIPVEEAMKILVQRNGKVTFPATRPATQPQGRPNQ